MQLAVSILWSGFPLTSPGDSHSPIGFSQVSIIECLLWVGASVQVSLNPCAYLPRTGTRRLLYRMTIGAMRNPESIRQASEGRVTVLRTQLEDYSKEALKLQVSQRSSSSQQGRKLQLLNGVLCCLLGLLTVYLQSRGGI